MFHIDVAKIDRDVASVSEVFYKRLFKIFYLFQTYIAASGFMLQVFYLDVAYVSHICCKCMFQMFHMLLTYVAFKCLMLQVFRVSEVCSESHDVTSQVFYAT